MWSRSPSAFSLDWDHNNISLSSHTLGESAKATAVLKQSLKINLDLNGHLNPTWLKIESWLVVSLDAALKRPNLFVESANAIASLFSRIDFIIHFS